LLLILATPLLAQQNSTQSEKTANIDRLLKLVNVEKLQQSMMEQLMGLMKQSFDPQSLENESNRKILSRFSDLLKEEMLKIDFTAINREFYDKYFSNDEILGLIAFYESPIGKKTLQILPALQTEATNRGAEFGQQAALKALDRWAAEYPEVQKNLQSQKPK
jgi:hypothetical protein